MQEQENNQKEHPDLYKRSIKGGYWVFAIRLATQALGLVKSIIVFNFLFSENLELIFVANLLIAALTTFTESGFHAALIQKKDNIESYLDTAWIIGILRGIVLFAAIYFAAPLFASFKVEPEKVSLAISVIRAMGACFLIRAFQNIGVVYFQKELEFHKTFRLTMAATVTDIVLSISLLLIYKSVWAVVVARLAAAVVGLVASYALCPYRPKFHFIPEKAGELWKFGKWLFGGNIIGYLLNEGDDWFVLFYYPEPLPFKLYRGAYRFALMPATYISNSISQVSFPSYSKIQHDLPRLREAYLKVLKATALTAIPIALLIFTLGPDFVRLFLVEESHGMILVIQIFAIKGFYGVIGYTRGPLLRAMGKPQYLTYLMGLRLLMLSVMIYPFTKAWGIGGTALTFVAINLIIDPFATLLTSKILQARTMTLLSPLAIPLIASAVMALCLASIKLLMIHQLSIFSFFILISFGVIVYLILILLLDSFCRQGFREMVYDQFLVIKQKFIRF